MDSEQASYLTSDFCQLCYTNGHTQIQCPDVHCAICRRKGHASVKCAASEVRIFKEQLEIEDISYMVDALFRTGHGLRELSFRDTKFGDEGARQIARLIEANHPIYSIRLLGNDIGDRGCQAISL